MPRRERAFMTDYNILEVCTYQFSTCTKPANIPCPIKQELEGVKDVGKWARISNKAPSCQYTGIKLSKGQYVNRRIGVVV